MSRHISAAPIKQSIVVDAPIEHAFKVFTEDFGSFKPREHNLLSVPIAETVFEPRVGGHVFDRGIDGSECRWARVLAWHIRVLTLLASGASELGHQPALAAAQQLHGTRRACSRELSAKLEAVRRQADAPLRAIGTQGEGEHQATRDRNVSSSDAKGLLWSNPSSAGLIAMGTGASGNRRCSA
ncbi:hypothetical protein [Bradyrhizobium sp. NC92]|uniref:hypothetical protein n=1 Tax=Bradyrhizobium sp. (strain NC92) TaxID=55395 RepID=UPI0021A9868B|nr:hypothetical protein [Bradyrhizobium sp. NC92]UWU66277.1 hypothetical protein N2602_23870 [Bradyrhizobium sp. NC92]